MRTLLPGRIRAEGLPAWECTIRDLSLAGAMLELPPDLFLPDEFALEIPKWKQAHWVKLVWRRERWAGVQFLSLLEL